MAEFAAASSAAGLFSLGLEVTRGLVKYCQAWKSLPKDMEVLDTRLQNLAQLLEVLGGIISSAGVDRKRPAYLCVDTAVIACATGQQDLHTIWKKYVVRDGGKPKLKTTMNRALYAYISTLKTTLDRLQSNLGTALDIFQIQQLQIVLDRQSESTEMSKLKRNNAIVTSAPVVLNRSEESCEVEGNMHRVEHALMKQLRPLEESIQCLQRDLAVRPDLRRDLHDEALGLLRLESDKAQQVTAYLSDSRRLRRPYLKAICACGDQAQNLRFCMEFVAL